MTLVRIPFDRAIARESGSGDISTASLLRAAGIALAVFAMICLTEVRRLPAWAPEPTPAPTATDSATPSPSATATCGTESAGGCDTPTPTPDGSPSPSPTDDGPTPSPTDGGPTPSPTGTGGPSPTPTCNPDVEPDCEGTTPTMTATSPPTGTPSPTPDGTGTPTGTPSPTPTPDCEDPNSINFGDCGDTPTPGPTTTPGGPPTPEPTPRSPPSPTPSQSPTPGGGDGPCDGTNEGQPCSLTPPTQADLNIINEFGSFPNLALGNFCIEALPGPPYVCHDWALGFTTHKEYDEFPGDGNEVLSINDLKAWRDACDAGEITGCHSRPGHRVYARLPFGAAPNHKTTYLRHSSVHDKTIPELPHQMCEVHGHSSKMSGLVNRGYRINHQADGVENPDPMQGFGRVVYSF